MPPPESSAAAASSRRWDYDALSPYFELRAPYHPDIIDAALREIGHAAVGRVADIGAGTGRCAQMLAAAGWRVDAVEPSAPMRAVGLRATSGRPVAWHDGVGERTGLAAGHYELVCFGSSFNVVDAGSALREARRLLKRDGVLLCLFNHRDLADPLQARIQDLIEARIPGYRHGARREDLSAQIDACGLFGPVRKLELALTHRSSAADFVDGFRAHATLVRQAGERLEAILDDLRQLLAARREVELPFHTRAWVARAQ